LAAVSGTDPLVGIPRPSTRSHRIKSHTRNSSTTTLGIERCAKQFTSISCRFDWSRTPGCIRVCAAPAMIRTRGC
jgi:hypothetical protein